MREYTIGVSCIQETRSVNSDYYFTDDGFLVVLSGCTGTTHDFAGVGFIISPAVVHQVVGFCQYSSRIACLKLRVVGGVIALFSVYAPHNLKDLPMRLEFYEHLSDLYSKTSVNGPKYFLGDFNARLGHRLPGESNVMGRYGYGAAAGHRVEVPNRDLLVEFCIQHQLMLANTFFNTPLEQRVTYFEPRACPKDDITPTTFFVLDLLLVQQEHLTDVLECLSDRNASLASHHFPVRVALNLSMPQARSNYRPSVDWGLLKDTDIGHRFSQKLADKIEGTEAEHDWAPYCDVVHSLAESELPPRRKQPNKPWITEATLELLAQKRNARQSGNWTLEKTLRAETKRAARKDRAAWLEKLGADGDWGKLKQLRKGCKHKQGRLRSMAGQFVSSEERAATLAEHLEKVQWCVRPITLIPGADECLNPEIPIKEGLIEMVELRKAIRKMKSGRATKDHDIPVELFKALEQDDTLSTLLHICNEAWTSKLIPTEWSLAVVTMIFKKGDPGNCSNYRPICLLSVAYKLFNSILKQRFLDAGVDDLLWQSQFGFRAKCSTEDAIFIARRRLESARAHRFGSVAMLALDWKAAFDSIHIDSLLDALRRFGIPSSFLDMIASMLGAREFSVRDCGSTSEACRQRSGISQGCTLSPLLFIMVMTVLLHDAVGLLGESAKAAYQKGDLSELLFADDTLLIGVSDSCLTEFLDAVYTAGLRYGMELHPSKFQLISTSGGAQVYAPGTGNMVPVADSMVYLGSILTSDGKVERELSRRIGCAKADFDALAKVWTHSSLTWKRKLSIYSSLVESKLLYAMTSCCLTRADERRLDGFQNRCLRKILGIKSAYISRVSNAIVREKAHHPAATAILRKRRYMLLGKVLRSPSDHPLRTCCFVPGTHYPINDFYVRRVGRPSHEWVKQMISDVNVVFGSIEIASDLAADKLHWKRVVSQKLGF